MGYFIICLYPLNILAQGGIHCILRCVAYFSFSPPSTSLYCGFVCCLRQLYILLRIPSSNPFHFQSEYPRFRRPFWPYAFEHPIGHPVQRSGPQFQQAILAICIRASAQHSIRLPFKHPSIGSSFTPNQSKHKDMFQPLS